LAEEPRRDESNCCKCEGVKYNLLSAVLINAFKEEQAQIERQQTQIQQQQSQIDDLKASRLSGPPAGICK
jgi:hypothetical protein